MKYRDYKDFYEGGLYHVYNRGHNKMKIFRDDQDYDFFLQRLAEILNMKRAQSRWIHPLPEGSFKIMAYCLMPNHFHILISQEKGIKISELMRKLLTSYGVYFNNKYNQVGKIFQDRFKAKEVGNDEYLIPLSAYIHRNPNQWLTWKYSSLSDYLDNRNESIVDVSLILSIFGKKQEEYRKYVKNYRNRVELSISDLIFNE